ncbi:hypothetical protein DLJ47_01900 [Micromonospora sp. S4605]|uniref:hypothetical protein n=1 Tax=Micromonospora sp. S4605 TaxID=1420897 RepID=UPI000D6F8027|nr:hypothetical protein [Micromonospora sp. S4605]PWU57686.1 hypothetical protein DLJ47_01900 [Micromonospora sp. S4605]
MTTPNENARALRRGSIESAKARVKNRRQKVEQELMDALEAADRRQRLLHGAASADETARLTARYKKGI